MKYSLIFISNNTREIANEKFDNYDDALKWAGKIIKKFCEERNFKTYYTRMWKDNNTTIFDVGSHSEFFHLVQEENNEE